MKVNIEDREYFKDNVATYKDLGELQILDFKVPGQFYKSLRYVFDGNKMYVSGDYGSAVFELTWHGTPWNFEINIGYFTEKLAAYHEDKTSFNPDKACENLEEYYQDFKNDNFDSISSLEEELKDQEENLLKLQEIKEPDENELEEIEESKNLIESLIKDLEEEKEDEDYIKLREIFDRLKDIADCCDSCSEWVNEVNNCDELEDLSDWDCDYWEWIYSIGDDVPKRVEIYLIGLTLAAEQLKPIK